MVLKLGGEKPVELGVVLSSLDGDGEGVDGEEVVAGFRVGLEAGQQQAHGKLEGCCEERHIICGLGEVIAGCRVVALIDLLSNLWRQVEKAKGFLGSFRCLEFLVSGIQVFLTNIHRRTTRGKLVASLFISYWHNDVVVDACIQGLNSSSSTRSDALWREM